MIYPPPYAIDDDGILQTPSTERLLFAIEPIDDDDNGGAVTALSGHHKASLKLTGPNKHYIEILIPPQTPSRPVYLTWDEAPLAAFVANPYPRASEPAVILEFSEAASKSSAALHLATCRASLAQVRLGKSHLAGLRAPSGVRGHLRWRRPSQLDWQNEDLSSSDASRRLSFAGAPVPISTIERINTVLRDQSFDVALDFGAFGSIAAQAIPAVKELRAGIRIPRNLRERIEWLCKASGAFVTAERLALSALDDASLVRHFSGISVGVGLLAHRRAIERALEKTAGTRMS
jgi:hypothetical protein